MRINKISDGSALDSYFEVMSRFNKKASIATAIRDAFDVAGVAAKFKRLHLGDATHLKSLLNNADDAALLQRYLVDGSSDMIAPFLRTQNNPDLTAIVYKSIKDGNPGILEDSASHIAAARQSVAELKESIGNPTYLPPDPRGDIGLSRAAPAKSGVPATRGGANALEDALRAAREAGKNSPEVLDFVRIADGSFPHIDDMARAESEVHQTISTLTTAIKNGDNIDPKILSDMADAIKKNEEAIAKILPKLGEIETALKALPTTLADDAAKAADDVAVEAATRLVKAGEEGLTTAATDLAAAKKALAEQVPPPVGAKEGEKALAAAAEKTAKGAKDLGAAVAKSGRFSRVIRSAFVAKIVKGLVGVGLLGGAWHTYKQYKHSSGDKEDEPGTSGTQSSIGGGGSSAAPMSAEDAIKAYFDTGDTSGLKGIIKSSGKYTNLMIFPEPISGLRLAFFNSGRGKRERLNQIVLIETNENTRLVFAFLNTQEGKYFLKYIKDQVGDPQDALNEAVEKIYQHRLYATPGRARRFVMGRKLRQIPSGRVDQKTKKIRRRTMRGLASDRSNKLDLLNKVSSGKTISTNNYENTDITFFKEADEVSKSYCKDAVKDLNNSDKTVREYFAGLGRLYDDKSETPKTDFKTLYNVTEETGSELVNAAHPKAVVVLDSIRDGGLVENLLEQSQKGREIALSTPSGNFRANYAWVRGLLKKEG